MKLSDSNGCPAMWNFVFARAFWTHRSVKVGIVLGDVASFGKQNNQQQTNKQNKGFTTVTTDPGGIC